MQKFILLVFLMIFVTTHGWAEENDCNLSSIKLLDGYVLKIGKGIDSFGADITREGGVTIKFSAGGLAATPAAYPTHKDEFKWFQKQIIDGQSVYLALTKSEAEGATSLVVTYSSGSTRFYNFITKVSSPSDVAEALTMILTYKTPSQN